MHWFVVAAVAALALTVAAPAAAGDNEPVYGSDVWSHHPADGGQPQVWVRGQEGRVLSNSQGDAWVASPDGKALSNNQGQVWLRGPNAVSNERGDVWLHNGQGDSRMWIRDRDAVLGPKGQVYIHNQPGAAPGAAGGGPDYWIRFK